MTRTQTKTAKSPGKAKAPTPLLRKSTKSKAGNKSQSKAPSKNLAAKKTASKKSRATGLLAANKTTKGAKTSALTVQKWLFDNMDLRSAVDTWTELSSQNSEAAARKAEQRLTEVRQLLQQLQQKITDLSS